VYDVFLSCEDEKISLDNHRIDSKRLFESCEVGDVVEMAFRKFYNKKDEYTDWCIAY
jgi:hypothetical protein